MQPSREKAVHDVACGRELHVVELPRGDGLDSFRCDPSCKKFCFRKKWKQFLFCVSLYYNLIVIVGGFPCPPFCYRGSVLSRVLGLPSRLRTIGLTEPIRWVGTSSLERGSFRKFHSAQSTHRVVPALIGLTAFFISPVSLCRSLFRGAFAPSSSTRQSKAARSCDGTRAATLTACLAFPLQIEPALAGLRFDLVTLSWQDLLGEVSTMGCIQLSGQPRYTASGVALH